MNISRILGRLQVEASRMMPGRFDPINPAKGYYRIASVGEYDFYRVKPYDYKIVAAFGSIIVGQKGNKLKIWPDYKNRLHVYRVELNRERFRGLLEGSKISNVFAVPYMRESRPGHLYKRVRIVVITDKCQVFHNYPDREKACAGEEEWGDICRFEESAIWDIPGRKYPTQNKEPEKCEIYNPCLPKICYEYHPAISERGEYGGAGFAKTTKVIEQGCAVDVSRFYFPIRAEVSNSFCYMGGYEPDYKMTLLGTYRANKDQGVRTVIWATSDGGRNWYAKYEFADEGSYDFKQGVDTWGKNFGNPICGTVFSHPQHGSIQMYRRDLEHDEEKNSKGDIFAFGEQIQVDQILNGEIVEVVTKEPHHLVTGNIVVLKGQINDEWSVLLNNSISEKQCGNGVLFKVEVLGEKRIALYECVSNPQHNIACRHIHHINRVRDGWILGTGEVYPNGWMYYIQMKEADSFSRIAAFDDLKFYRLTDNVKAVQRTVGADWDERNHCFIFASDHDLLPRPEQVLPLGQKIQRNSMGIYKGDISDINDFDKYEIIYEAQEPSFFFRLCNSDYIFCGMRGEIAVGSQYGANWEKGRIDDTFYCYRGSTYDYHVVDEYVIVKKDRKK